MSRTGSPILETPDIIGQYAGLVGQALRDAQQQRSIDEYRRLQQEAQAQQFAYRQQQDAQGLRQDQTDAAAINAAAAGQQPSMAGVSAAGAGRIASMRQQMEEARQRRFEQELKTLEPHVLKGNKMAMANWDAIRSRQTGEDRKGEGAAWYQGAIDSFEQQKELERQAKMAEAEMARMLDRHNALAQAAYLGMDTTGMDGTQGPSATPQAGSFVDMAPQDRRAAMTDEFARRRAAEKAAAGQMTPTDFETAVRRHMVNNPRATRAQAEAYVGGSTGYGQGGKRTMTLDSNNSQRSEESAQRARDAAELTAKAIRLEGLIAAAKADGSNVVHDGKGSMSVGYAEEMASKLKAQATETKAGVRTNNGPTTGQPRANAGQQKTSAAPPSLKERARAIWQASGGRLTPEQAMQQAIGEGGK